MSTQPSARCSRAAGADHSRYRRRGVPEEFARFTTDNIEPQTEKQESGLVVINRMLDEWAEGSVMSGGLVMYGPSGSGKTAYAAALACGVEDVLVEQDAALPASKRRHVGWVSAVNYVERHKRLFSLHDIWKSWTVSDQERADAYHDWSQGQAWFDSFASPRIALLVIDDLGKERQTAFSQETMHNMIRSRLDVGLPVVITTIISSWDVADRYGAAFEQAIYKACVELRLDGEKG